MSYGNIKNHKIEGLYPLSLYLPLWKTQKPQGRSNWLSLCLDPPLTRPSLFRVNCFMKEIPIIIETCPFICYANQWNGFYMTGTSVMKELKISITGTILLNDSGLWTSSLFKVNNRKTRTRCEICSKSTIKTPERRQASFWCLYCWIGTYFTHCSKFFYS